jgi:serine/threonine-protein kinase
MAIVPQMVGLSLEAAQEEAARANLGLVIEERDDPDHPVPTVLEQDPSAGQTVPAGSQLKLVVSRQVASSEVPDVLGFTLDEVREGLESRGWTLATETIWSGEPEGRIVQVNPPIGTALAGGATLTLTLSGGSDDPIPIEANLDNAVFLESVELLDGRFSPGETIPLVLRWRGLQSISESYTVFVHLLGPQGGLIDQDDHEPREGDTSRPTSTWIPGVIVPDRHTVIIPPNAASGVYQLRTGMYVPSADNLRLPVVDAGRATEEGDSILLLEVQVGP